MNRGRINSNTEKTEVNKRYTKHSHSLQIYK